MEILAIIESPAGGEERAATTLLNEVNALEIKVIRKNIPALKKTGFFYYILWILTSLLRTAHFLLIHRRTTIVYTTTYTAALACILVSFFTKQKVFFHYHGNRIPVIPEKTWFWHRRITQTLKRQLVLFLHRITWERVSVFCSPSAETLEFLKKRFSKLGKAQLILPNVIDPTQFFPATNKHKLALKQRYGIKSKLVISIVGRVNPLKNHLDSIMLVRNLIKNLRIDITLLIAAPSKGNDSEYIKLIRGDLEYFKIPYQFLFDVQPVREVYQMSDLIISHSKIEVFPLTILESAACGIPLFATRNGNSEKLLRKIDSSLILDNQNMIFDYVLNIDRYDFLRNKLLTFSQKNNLHISSRKFIRSISLLFLRTHE